jgi:Outer membrane lipoprotein-sorting protein
MKQSTLRALLTVLAFSLLTTPALAAPTAREIINDAFEAGRLDGSEGVMTLTIMNKKGQKRVRKIASVTKLVDGGATEKKLSRFLSPADVKGTGFLTFDYDKKDDDMWLYMPALRKTRRIVSSEKSKSFMGSEFAYADMNIPNLDDFTYSLEAAGASEIIDGVACYVIVSIPRNDDIADDNGYSKRKAWLGKDDKVIRKAVYWDLDGERLKVMTATKITVLDPEKKRARPMHLEMVNEQNGRKSILDIEKLQLVRDVKDEYFTTRYLERQ